MVKRTCAAALGLLLVFVLSACRGTPAEIIMIPDAAGIDDASFNQGTWEGIRLYAGVNNKTCNYYQPTGQNDRAYYAAISKGVQNGAEIVILPGHAFEFVVGEAQVDYPKVHFVLLDSNPADGPAENTVGITFAEEQAGYLAGYAAVADGYTRLGFIGGSPVPGVTGYGFGYVQGANDAAKTFDRQVQMRYAYNGQFVENDEARALAGDWYAGGTEVIFACGGAMNFSVFAAAEEAGGKTIGVDVDQSGVSSTVLTSAIKGLGAVAGRTLEQFYTGQFPGGQNLVMGIPEGAVGLAIENSRFESFSQQDYEELLRKLSSGEVTVVRDDGEGGAPISPLEIDAELDALEMEYFD
ncbi:BMP family ABC transporter substrate-binding protein [Ruminococcaceae bacterium OttesenSCG-928-I18]|nr:BMP family ABC transporter substrate-binding protein [Ruminococcaceae bacterium OttesenSCG-928-I18]